jgi:hypothetical protein
VYLVVEVEEVQAEGWVSLDDENTAVKEEVKFGKNCFDGAWW